MANYVAYYRVSTERQGKSGLGLDAQRATVQSFAGEGTILGEYVEVESGANNARQELASAIGHARLSGATLIIARLDRLSRNVAFIAALMDSGIDFVCCDNPHANRFTIHVLAAMAEYERGLISERTKAALAAAKKRGKKLGGYRHDLGQYGSKGGKASAMIRAVRAGQYATYLTGAIVKMGLSLGSPPDELADRLAASGFTSPTGRRLTGRQVTRALQRARAMA